MKAVFELTKDTSKKQIEQKEESDGQVAREEEHRKVVFVVRGQHYVWEIRRSYQYDHTLEASIKINKIFDSLERISEDVEADYWEDENPRKDRE